MFVKIRIFGEKIGKMASFQFSIAPIVKSDPVSIYGRFKPNSNIDIKARTGLLVNRNEWSKAKQKVKDNSKNALIAKEVNDNLALLKNTVLEQFNIDFANGIDINKKWLENTFKTALNQPISEDEDKKYYLEDFVEHYLAISKQRINKRTGNKIKQGTLKDYVATLNKIKLFRINKENTKIKLINVDMDYYRSFKDFLDENMGLASNTIGGHISNLKIFLKNAEKEGYNVHNGYKTGDFIEPKNDTYDTYLNINEIQRIFDYDFKNDRLDNVKDWLIISVWTGLRISDLLKLNINEHLKGNFIQKKNYKTGIITVIPIHEQVNKIFAKRNGKFPREITDQKYNMYVKEVCKIVGINEQIKGAKICMKEFTYKDLDGKKITKKLQRNEIDVYPKYELISSHTGRRSFASNHYGKIDNLTLMNITGHKTESQFLEYVKITPTEHAEKLMELWKKYNHEH